MFTCQMRTKSKEDQWVISLSSQKALGRHKGGTGQGGEAALRIDLNCQQGNRGGKQAGGKGGRGGDQGTQDTSSGPGTSGDRPGGEERAGGREREREEEKERGRGRGRPTTRRRQERGEQGRGGGEEGEGDGRCRRAVAKGRGHVPHNARGT